MQIWKNMNKWIVIRYTNIKFMSSTKSNSNSTQRTYWKYVGIGLDNGLVPGSRQAIIIT